LALPLVGSAYGVRAVYLSVAALIVFGIVQFSIGYQPAANTVSGAVSSARLDRRTLTAVITAGMIWGAYNIGFAMIFSFGPTMLVERGWSIPAAGSAISIVLWVATLGAPVGGLLADWTKRPRLVLVGGCILFALLMLALSRIHAVIPLVIAIGLISALPAGPIMSLPASVLQPATRAIGMGIFYTMYYGTMMLGPVIGGACATWTGSAAAALDFGAAMVLACPVILWGFDRISAAAKPI
jgi:MFS family permease